MPKGTFTTEYTVTVRMIVDIDNQDVAKKTELEDAIKRVLDNSQTDLKAHLEELGADLLNSESRLILSQVGELISC